jgi:TPP-dependent pyruvate/acetoin dehydrogenase alpha subunit
LIHTRARLVELGLAQDTIDALSAQARDAVEAAVEFARASPFPDPATDAATEYAP